MVYGLFLALALTTAQEEAIPDEEDPPRPQVLPQRSKPTHPPMRQTAAPNGPATDLAPSSVPLPPSNYDLSIDQTARARAEATNALEGGFDLRLASGMGL